jgi:hypothetical protein
MPPKDCSTVLCFTPLPGKPPSRKTVRKFYKQWREQQGLPDRCDLEGCQFHHNKLEWNGAPLPLILDHIGGDSQDNRPKRLRYLCPNCNEQQTSTRGGANAKRVEHTPGGYTRTERDGKRAFTMLLESGSFVLSGSDAAINLDKGAVPTIAGGLDDD